MLGSGKNVRKWRAGIADHVLLIAYKLCIANLFLFPGLQIILGKCLVFSYSKRLPFKEILYRFKINCSCNFLSLYVDSFDQIINIKIRVAG